jgi:hypothetical protein
LLRVGGKQRGRAQHDEDNARKRDPWMSPSGHSNLLVRV